MRAQSSYRLSCWNTYISARIAQLKTISIKAITDQFSKTKRKTWSTQLTEDKIEEEII